MDNVSIFDAMKRGAKPKAQKVEVGMSPREILKTLNWPMQPPMSAVDGMPGGTGLGIHPAMDPSRSWGYVDRVQPWWLRALGGKGN